MARIAGVNLPNHQHAEIALTAIYGIGRPRAQKICDAAGVLRSTKMKDMTEAELERLRDQIGRFAVEGDLRREVTMSIKRLMDLGLLPWPSSSQGPAVSRSAYEDQRPYPQRSAQADRRQEVIRK
jgi:small subunit ribosomal protein S13